MIKRWVAIGILGAIFLAPLSLQAEVVDRYVVRPCNITPGVGTSNYPGFNSIMPNNKLALPPGKSIVANGEPVHFYARVFDSNCVPISDAKIELWQANPGGRHLFASKAALATPDPTFSGAGRASTNNNGEFTFFTLYPGPYQYTIYKTDDEGNKYPIIIKRAPHFNIKITHPDYQPFSTNLFFFGDRRNIEDHILKQLADESKAKLMMRVAPRAQQSDWNLGIQATIDIFMPGKSAFRGF